MTCDGVKQKYLVRKIWLCLLKQKRNEIKDNELLLLVVNFIYIWLCFLKQKRNEIQDNKLMLLVVNFSCTQLKQWQGCSLQWSQSAAVEECTTRRSPQCWGCGWNRVGEDWGIPSPGTDPQGQGLLHIQWASPQCLHGWCVRRDVSSGSHTEEGV